MKLSIILPVYNPAQGWANTVVSNIHELRTKMPEIDIETIVVADGADNTAYVQEKNTLPATITLIEYQPNKGKGEAVRKGVRAATGDLYVYTDIDFPYTTTSMLAVIQQLREPASDVVIGIKDSSYYSHVPPLRRFISKLLRSLIRLLFRIPTDDTQCGLKGFNQRGKEIFLTTATERYLFDLEFVCRVSERSDIKLHQSVVSLKEGVTFREMNPSIMLSELKNLLKILFRGR